MRGPFNLGPLQVDFRVPSRLRGVFCLGKNSRQVAFVGQADWDLNTEIKSHSEDYSFFWYEPTLTPRERYVVHCRHYHKLLSETGLANPHPLPPERMDEKCPICGKSRNQLETPEPAAAVR